MLHKFILTDFEGPLDLLLHLIQKKKKDIIDIDVREISRQYVEFIREQQEANLEIASEYLIMASYLVELKSKAIIPLEKSEIKGEYRESQRQKLIEKLIEYKKFKDKIAFFKNSYHQRQQIHTKEPMNLKQFNIPLVNRGYGERWNVDNLSKAIGKMLKRISLQKPLNTSINTKPINLEQLELKILEKTKNKHKINMTSLFLERNDHQYVIATIVCVLDLTKNRLLKITQQKEFEDIILEGRN